MAASGSAHAPELRALRLARKRSMLDQRIQQLGFVNWNEPLACSGSPLLAFCRHCAD
jgi:hypothetical protein